MQLNDEKSVFENLTNETKQSNREQDEREREEKRLVEIVN